MLCKVTADISFFLFWHFVPPSSFLFFHPVTFSSDVLGISTVLCSLGWNLSFLYSSEYFVLFLLGIIWISLLFLRIPIWPLFSDLSATEFSFFWNLIFSWNLYSRIPFSCFSVVFTYEVLILLFADSLHHEVWYIYHEELNMQCVTQSLNYQLMYLRILTTKWILYVLSVSIYREYLVHVVYLCILSMVHVKLAGCCVCQNGGS